MVPSTDIMPRDESFALALFGRARKVQDAFFAVAAGRERVDLKRIVEAVSVVIARCPDRASRSGVRTNLAFAVAPFFSAKTCSAPLPEPRAVIRGPRYDTPCGTKNCR